MLLHRLRGLCDNGDNLPEQFQDKEFIYTIREYSTFFLFLVGQQKLKTIFFFQQPKGQPNGQPMTLRVRQDMGLKHFPWHLRYLGQSEIGDKNRATMVRSCIDVACSPNIGQFLTELGFKLHFTFVTRGYLFKKGRMKVIVAKILRNLPGTETLEAITPSYLVEVRTVLMIFLVRKRYKINLTFLQPF